MPWIKQGLIFKPDGRFDWSTSHAQVPTALLLSDCIRIYYATRDERGRSLTSFIDVARDNPAKILYTHDRPILPLGKPGTFDQDGVMAGCVVHGDREGEVWFYYTGWTRGNTVSYHLAIGAAKSTDNGVTFERICEGPVVDRTQAEAYMTMSPYILRERNLWRMWYGSGTGWVEIHGKPEPLYIIKYAESQDGIHWRQDNITCISPIHPLEANTRGSVLKTQNGYEMWFSHRHSQDFRGGAGAYRIGYAISTDGINWERQGDAEGLSLSPSGWDNEMITYPNVIEADGRRIMFHNGNGFGAAGFGYAIWKSA